MGSEVVATARGGGGQGGSARGRRGVRRGGGVRRLPTSEFLGRFRVRMIRGTNVPRTSIPRSAVMQFAVQAGPIPKNHGNWPKSEL